MKNLLTLLITLLITLSSLAQQGINYKAVLEDGSGNLLAGTFMNVQFTIHETTETGTIVYQEDHNYTTDANGLLIHNIGSEPSPSIGVFADIDWGADKHFLQVTIAYSGGTVNFDATEFMAVPYALHAANVSGLEKINENGQTGWRLKNVDPANYGDIGLDAVDLSINTSFINGLMGATGEISTALGTQTTASGVGSTAMGIGSEASGVVSTAMGYTTIASGLASVAVGNSNIDITSAIFLVGNGDFNLGDPIRSNALEVYQNGTITAPSFDISEITDDKALITKEFFDTNVPTIPDAPTGLEAIDEGNGIGWRLKGFEPANYGPIGYNAIDLSTFFQASTTKGATGDYSYALGIGARASGNFSTSTGYQTTASGAASTAMGIITNAPSTVETVIGQYNTDYTLSNVNGSGDIYWNPTDRLFVIGNGESAGTKNNALTVLKNGNATFDGKIQHTSTGTANMIPIAYGIVESNGNVRADTGNFIAEVDSGVFTIDVNGEDLSYDDTICIVTPISSASRSSGTLIADGNIDGDSDIIVRIFNASGALAATTFQFVIYKL